MTEYRQPDDRSAVNPPSTGNRLLEVNHLSMEFVVQEGIVRAVDDVSFYVRENEVVGMVGETGCGKSVTVNSLMRLIQPPGRITRGEVLLNGRDLMNMSEVQMRSVRGCEIAMIFQRPMTSMNPVFTLGSQLIDVIRLHRSVSEEEARRIAVDSLKAVALGSPESLLPRYPFELSGGQQQRVMIAMALSCGSRLLIADEPTTALDVSVQLQILKLIRQIMDDTNMSTLVISHDMGVIGCVCDRIYVMYASRIVEHGPTEEIIGHPRHPYVIGLIQSIPAFEKNVSRLEHIHGEVPNPINPPSGCRFHPRCKYVEDVCRVEKPKLVKVGEEHYAACLRANDLPTQDENERKAPC